MSEVTLHLCTTCRQDPAVKATCAPVRSLEAAARRHANAQGYPLKLERTACLSACQQGLSAMIETTDGMVRLARVAHGDDVVTILQHRTRLLAGQPQDLGGPQVVSVMRWADWDQGE